MRKRILCTLLAAVMIVVMLPGLATSANAASQMTTSETLVDCIKEYEGFRSEAYVSGGQWSIGYGTSASPGDTVTREEADQALRAHLHSIEASLNSFITRYGLNLNQGQFDALACFTYNCGVAWMSQNGRFRTAVIKGATESEFLFAISLWANNGSTPDAGLLKRRLAEADMYLNGVYLQKSDTYTYTIFDANGGTPGSGGEDKMQGYRKNGSTDILVADPALAGSQFAGWYTAKDGGTKVTALTAGTAGKTLYAHYKSNGSSSWDSGSGVSGSDGNDEVIATGRVKCSTYVNVRKGAGTGNALVGKVANGTKVSIYQTTTVGSYKWGRIDSGWICMDYVVLDDDNSGGSSSDYKEGTVTANNVNVRTGAGTQYSVVTRYSRGTAVKVYEQKTVGSLRWGRIGTERWICMAYVDLDNSGSSNVDDSDETVTGKVTGATTLNVRSGPGTTYEKVGSLGGGTKVTIYERTTRAGTQWGRIANGRWICMSYVTLTDEDDNSGNSSTTDGDKATVTGASQLNVRSGPGTSYNRVKFLNKGASITIYEYTTTNGQRWGRIGTNQWVCMEYVTVDGSNDSAAGETGTGTVTSKTYLNVRTGAGTSYSLAARLAPGTTVNILEQTKVNGTWWGRTSQGWVCMDYISMGTSKWN